jgi:nucleotide-binding universal stress UspA family protein
VFGQILVGYDGSTGAERARAVANSQARLQQAERWAVAVEEHLPRFAATVGEFEEEKVEADRDFSDRLDAARQLAAQAGGTLRFLIRPGHPARAIVDIAQEGEFDVIILGHRGRSGVWVPFLGTTAEKGSHHAPCSVLIVREGKGA